MAVPHGFVEKLAELSAAGKSFVSVTLVETIGSTPQDAGTKMLVDESGLVFGTVGGGRVENKAIGHAQALLTNSNGTHANSAGKNPNSSALAAGSQTCMLVEWNLQRDVGMTCGGVVKLLFEAYNFREWRIIVFGAGHVAQALVRLLLLLECRVVCIDPRADWLAKLPVSPKLHAIQLAEPREFVPNLRRDDFVLCMTMGHKTDRPILQAILEKNLPLPRREGRGEGESGTNDDAIKTTLGTENKPDRANINSSSPPHPNPLPEGEGTEFLSARCLPYLGVIGSAAKRKVLERELTEAGLNPQLFQSIRCPIGLPLGTNHPGEIAVSIAAELIQVRDAISPVAG